MMLAERVLHLLKKIDRDETFSPSLTAKHMPLPVLYEPYERQYA